MFPKDPPNLMRECLSLATGALGYVSPNPMVGCLLIKEGELVSRGIHSQYGGDHAERAALKALEASGIAPDGLTAIVNLEPCSHHGKTPPCVDLLIESGISRVFVGTSDPNPQVSGAGLLRLQSAGVEVHQPILAEECRAMNRRFFCHMERRRPYIILKWAQTADGFLAKADGSSKWISCESSRQLVHLWRSHEDAVLVGGETLRRDDPELSVRLIHGRDPRRIVLTSNAHSLLGARVLNSNKHIFVVGPLNNRCPATLEGAVIDLRTPGFSLPNTLEQLLNHNIQSILVEGGTQTLNLFLENGIWDEVRVFTAPMHFGSGIRAPTLPAGHYNYWTMRSGDDMLCVSSPQLSQGMVRFIAELEGWSTLLT